ncbi:MAG TPA: VCBS repeat-containing protein [Chitinophagaceae bacterium]|nr:VCBS repeat-containing protein [Chitinophagaceae bacterium]
MKKNPLNLIAAAFVFIICACNQSHKLSEEELRRDATYDASKVVKLNSESGKQFDILTGESTGVDFINHLEETFQVNHFRYLYMFQGGGPCIGDINGDGLQDIFMVGNINPCKLYLNKGNLKFEDITAKCGINKLPTEWTMSAVMVDFDGDGLLDIYENLGRWEDSTKRENRLWKNNGDLTFTEVSKKYGLNDNTYSQMANFFDYDNDGDLDLYINTHPIDFVDKWKVKALQRVEQHTNSSNRFYINNGDGTYTEAHKKVGIDNHAYSLSGTAEDINGDGYLDLYVANDFAMNDFVYINNGHGKFIDESLKVITKTGINAMGSDISDFNNDGLPDIMIADMDMADNYQYKTFMLANPIEQMRVMLNAGYGYQSRGNSLQLNNGDGTFSEIARTAGVFTTNWSWSTFFADFDNDGNKDIFIGNGYVQDLHIDVSEMHSKLRRACRINDSNLFYSVRKQLHTVELTSPNFIFKNNGDLTFSDMRTDWGVYYPSITYGATYADLDNDGDLDIVCNNANEPAFIYRNNAEKMPEKNNWISFGFKGYAKNSGGLGTKVVIHYDGGKLQTIQHTNVRGYISSTQNDCHFGLGKINKIDTVEVEWLDGAKQVLTNINANQFVLLDHANASKETHFQKRELPPAIFVKAHDNLGIDFTHKEDDYDDFLREFTLPHKMSCLGPGMSAGDVNGDGLDDIFVGGAEDQSGAIYIQQKDGKFKKSGFVKDNMKYEDAGSLIIDVDGDGDNDLVVTSGGNEQKSGDKTYEVRLYLNDGKGNFKRSADAMPANYFSASNVVGADYDKDGDMDLFIAGRQVPGHYLESTSSYIYRNDKGKFTDVTKDIAPVLKDIGMVSSAVWSDFDGDNNIDIVLGGDWMPVTFLKNTNGKFIDVTANTGLTNFTGWWQSITAADLDNDGDMDYICGNFGTNRRFKNTVSEKDGKPLPLEAFSYDFDGNGTQDFVMAYYQHDKLYTVKTRERLMEQIPTVQQLAPTWDAYGKATIQDLFGDKLNKAIHKTAYEFHSCVLINEGNGKFQPKYLPNEAQISVMLGTVVDDFNEDGIPDILTHGNFYNTDMETTRYDASTGILLLGKGNGEFTPVPSRISGFWSKGDTKSLIVLLNHSRAPQYVCAGSNAPVGVYALTGHSHDMLKPSAKDAYAVATMNDGTKRKMEFCAGSGYLSQCTKYIRVTPQMKQVDVYDVNGNAKTLYPALMAKK